MSRTVPALAAVVLIGPLILPSLFSLHQKAAGETQQTPVVGSSDSADRDEDGLPDTLEQELAEKYAPIVYHNKIEKNFPSNVEDFLRKTSLFFYDKGCSPDANSDPEHACAQPPSDLSGMSCLIDKNPDMRVPKIHRWRFDDPCRRRTFYADELLDRNKKLTFYLSDVADKDRQGDSDTKKWITYFHAYINDRCVDANGTEKCGVTIQYWRFYAYNTGPFPGGLGSHGGDWEGVHVVLDQTYQPVEVRLLGHRGISQIKRPQDQAWAPNQRWGALRWENDHPKISSENGGHASSALAEDNDSRYIRQETWTGGKVRWPLRQAFHPGKSTDNDRFALRNLGEKTRPMTGMYFIQYSGLWGSPGWTVPLVGPISSGYWGPAYNETSRGPNEFITAWCKGMKQLNRQVEDNQSGRIRECYPADTH